MAAASDQHYLYEADYVMLNRLALGLPSERTIYFAMFCLTKWRPCLSYREATVLAVTT